MKAIIAVVLLIAGVSAWPQNKGINIFQRNGIASNIDLKNERLISDTIAAAIQDVSQSIKDAGLDPMEIDSLITGYALPVPVLFNAQVLIEEILFTGLSNIVINNLSFNILTYRLTLDIELPEIFLGIKIGELNVVLFGTDYSASASGSFAIRRPRIRGNVRVSVGIISGISLRSLDLSLSLGGIESNLNVVVQNYDLSNYLNRLLGTTIPNTLREFSAEIDELLEIVATQVIEAVL